MNPHLRMPGATLLTRLRVYDTEAPDGQLGGTPHFHLCCSEMYFALSGSGAVEIIDSNGFKRIDLPTHAAFLFTAGTLHRLVNPTRDLEILIIMQNSGLPERGDTIGTFPLEILSDDLRYHKAIRASSLEEAYKRRDLAVDGFNEAKAAFTKSLEEGRAHLAKVYAQGRARSIARSKEWYDVVTKGAFAEAQDSLQQIVAATNNKLDYLSEADHHLMPAKDCSTVGFCGHLNRYFDPATLLMEGTRISG